MNKISRRELLRVSVPTTVSSFLGLSLISSVAKGSEPEITKKLKIIVVGAHPDDPETGCGGTMALLANEGHDVISAYLTRGEAGIRGKSHNEAATIRTAEALRACEILKVRPKFLGQIDGNCEITKDKYQTISDYFNEEKPDIIFNHWPIDTHRDHRISSNLVYDAWQSMEKKPALFYFEVMTGQQSQNFTPTNYVDISFTVETKHQACFAHKSQKIVDDYADSHGKMELFRGMEFNSSFAEAFVRHFQSPDVILF